MGAEATSPAEGAQRDVEDHHDEGADEVESAFHLTVEAGTRRLDRPLPTLLATGFVGGVDVSVGVFAVLLVLDRTNNPLLAALAFTIGFISLTLAKSELFTENFLVPIAALVARQRGVGAVARLWFGTGVMNLAGGWIIAAIVMSAFPEFGEEANELGLHFAELGIGWRSFAMAMFGGAIITMMTWMIEGSLSVGAKIVSAVIAGFLLSAGEINHCIVASLEMFHGLIAGADRYGYLDWATMFGWAALGNMVGGIGLVTVLRLVQVGAPALRGEQRRLRAQELDVLLEKRRRR